MTSSVKIAIEATRLANNKIDNSLNNNIALKYSKILLVNKNL